MYLVNEKDEREEELNKKIHELNKELEMFKSNKMDLETEVDILKKNSLRMDITEIKSESNVKLKSEIEYRDKKIESLTQQLADEKQANSEEIEDIHVRNLF